MAQKARQILSQSYSFPINPIKPIPTPYGIQDTILIQFRLIRLANRAARPQHNAILRFSQRRYVNVQLAIRFFDMFYWKQTRSEKNRQGVACAISANYKLSIDPTDRPELVSEDKSGYKAVDTREKLSLIVGSSFGYKDGFKRIER